MDLDLKQSLWKQFGACIDMLENAITMCPDNFWNTDEKFWYTSYHCLFYLDYYLTADPSAYVSPRPFSNSEFEGKLPERIYSKAELLAYLQASRAKCRNLIQGFTVETAKTRWVNPYRNFSMFEMLLYNMRHVQHHTAQLNKLLRQNLGNAPAWVAQTEGALG